MIGKNNKISFLKKDFLGSTVVICHSIIEAKNSGQHIFLRFSFDIVLETLLLFYFYVMC